MLPPLAPTLFWPPPLWRSGRASRASTCAKPPSAATACPYFGGLSSPTRPYTQPRCHARRAWHPSRATMRPAILGQCATAHHTAALKSLNLAGSTRPEAPSAAARGKPPSSAKRCATSALRLRTPLPPPPRRDGPRYCRDRPRGHQCNALGLPNQAPRPTLTPSAAKGRQALPGAGDAIAPPPAQRPTRHSRTNDGTTHGSPHTPHGL